MALSNAANLANIASGDAFTVDNINNRVGIASTLPTSTLDVVGIVSATAFYGDGSNLDGVASAGLGTAISETAPGDVIYYTDTVLSIGATITIDAPSSSNLAYTQYAEIAVEEDKDLIIADGDDFIPDILGLSTEGVTPLVGAGGRIRADNFTNKAGNGAPNFPSGLTGTTGTFSGAVSGTTGTFSDAVSGTTGTFSDAVSGTTGTFSDAVSGTTGTFSGNVSVGGTLTYEDVTNVDSIGLITARSGINVSGGGLTVTGISTFKGANFNGGLLLREKINITAGKLSDNLNINLNNGMVHLFTTTETTTAIPNIMSTVGINTQMDTGDAVAVTIITTAAAAGYSTCITIDNAYNDVKWSGGADPSTGGSSGNDVYALQIIKTGSAAYTVLGALNNFA